MPRTASPEIRRALVETAAALLARREAVTARTLAAATGTSTIALYTHFGGMDGLWRAVRQEGFVRLAAAATRISPSEDPVHDLAAYGVVYLQNAVAHPHLYRTMFDAGFELDDPAVANTTFGLLVESADRARAAGRFSSRSEPGAVATRLWSIGHGLASLVGTGVLPPGALREHAPETSIALFVAAGDEAKRARRSVKRAWDTLGASL